MAAATQIEPQNLEDPLKGLSKTQKLAAFLVLLGTEASSGILNEFDDREVEEITKEMVKQDFISPIMQNALMKEFSDIAFTALSSAVGGPNFARDVLERSMGSLKANEVINRLAPSKPKTLDAAVLREIQPRQLVNLLRKEQVQTWVLVVSYLEAARCAEILSMLPPDFRTDVIERLATMEPVSQDVVQQVLTMIKNRLQVRGQQDFSSSGGVKQVADVINILDDATSNQILSSLEERNPEVSKTVKKMLFSFEDIVEFDKNAVSRLLREVDFQVLAKALKTASEKLRGMVFAALSKRAAESLAEEIKFMPPIRLREVEEAQDKIVEAVRRLEAAGEISIGKKGGGDAVV